MKKLTLATAQITCQDGNISNNLARAAAMRWFWNWNVRTRNRRAKP